MQRLDGLGIAVMRVLRPGERLRADAGGVLQPQLQRVHADLLRQHVEHALHREGADRRARRAIGRRPSGGCSPRRSRPRARSRCRRARTRTCSAFMTGEPGNAPAWNLNSPSAAMILPSLLDADLHPHRRARGRAGGAEHVLAAHHSLHRDGRTSSTASTRPARHRPRSCRRSRRRSRPDRRAGRRPAFCRSCAVSARTAKCPWLELQISLWPSASKRATQACGSI